MRNNPTIDVFIPTYQPGPEFERTLKSLASQALKINRLCVINTGKNFWNTKFEKIFSGIEVTHIEKKDFDHGTVRYNAAKTSDADIIVFMTQDAVPADENLLTELTAPIIEGMASVSYARQLPRADADPIEKIGRLYNYPKKSKIKSKKDLNTLGIKTFFCSNVCAAYDRKVYNELGGFPHPVEFNEDMIFAAGVIEGGYCISYSADARVIHSHNYSGREQYKRNYLIGRTQAQYREIFEKYPSEGAGIKLVKSTAKELFKMGKGYLIFKLIWISGCKYLGYRAGKRSVKGE